MLIPAPSNKSFAESRRRLVKNEEMITKTIGLANANHLGKPVPPFKTTATKAIHLKIVVTIAEDHEHLLFLTVTIPYFYIFRLATI